MKRDEDDFKVRPSPPRSRGKAHAPRFVSRVLRASSKAGHSIGRSLSTGRAGRGARLGRGHVAAHLAGRMLDHRARRVVVKTRLVILKRAGAQSTLKHLRYLERDGVTREGGRGQLYGPDRDHVDATEFERRGREDRHQFRFIVSPDDAIELGDLKGFVRRYMAQMERDLGTRLDWVAVDHWNTDNPHSHIVLRGKDDQGADLVIARNYIGHGMRLRASELATAWLGRRSEREIQQGLSQEIRQDRWTTLDRALAAGSREGIVDLRNVPGDLGRRKRRALLIGRLDYLCTLGLAEKQRGGIWCVRPETEHVLRAMSERGDITRTIQRAFGDVGRRR